MPGSRRDRASPPSPILGPATHHNGTTHPTGGNRQGLRHAQQPLLGVSAICPGPGSLGETLLLPYEFDEFPKTELLAYGATWMSKPQHKLKKANHGRRPANAKARKAKRRKLRCRSQTVLVPQASASRGRCLPGCGRTTKTYHTTRRSSRESELPVVPSVPGPVVLETQDSWLLLRVSGLKTFVLGPIRVADVGRLRPERGLWRSVQRIFISPQMLRYYRVVQSTALRYFHD